MVRDELSVLAAFLAVAEERSFTKAGDRTRAFDRRVHARPLHSSLLLGPRMGPVTYRVLCLAHRLVLALPPGRT
jgi:hypothetical protein